MYSSYFFIIIPLLLTAYVHMWNPLGFPVSPPYDESIYIRRTIEVLFNYSPQEGLLYDHPFFLQIFLAAILWPVLNSMSSNLVAGDVHSIELIYLIFKVAMGILSVISTLLVYEIAKRYYNRNVAFIASIIFAVMPIMWTLRNVFLEPVQLPFLLISILFAVCVKKGLVKENGSNNKNKNKNRNRNTLILTLLSGIFLGLTLFTKISAFTFIPLVGYLLFSNRAMENRDFKSIALWLMPIVLIPSLWPAYALYEGQLDLWFKGIFFQTHRTAHSFFSSLSVDFNRDPVFLMIGIAGAVFSVVIKRDVLILLWVVPFLLYLYLIGFVSHWHFIPIFPAFCIAGANMITGLSDMIAKIAKRNNGKFQKILPYVVIGAIGIFGIVNTSIMITATDKSINEPHYKAAAFVVNYLQNNEKANKVSSDDNINEITVISHPFLSWSYSLFHIRAFYVDYYNSPVSVNTKHVLLVSDPALTYRLNQNLVDKEIEKYLHNADRVYTFDDSNPHSDNRINIYIHNK